MAKTAKTRVYELAKILEMDSKELLNQLMRLNFPVKSHMSTLDEKDVGEIKERFGKSGVVTERRISSAVIRRRVKPVKVEKPVDEKIVPLAEKAAKEISEEPEPKKEPVTAPEEEKRQIEGEVEEKRVSPSYPKYREKSAEIIKLPEYVAKTPEAMEKVPEVTEPPKALEIEEPVEAKKGKKRPKKKRSPEDVEEIVFKRPLRSKEVFDRAHLYEEDERALKLYRPRRSARAAAREIHKPEITVPKAIKRRIKLVETITVSELAKRLSVKGSEIIKKLMAWGVMATINQAIDFDTAVLIASDFNYEVEKVGFEEDEILRLQEDTEDMLQPRPPVVTVMGHVDHGKTSLLDVIRETKVTESEVGGITQHMGAYRVSLDGREIVFLDTPGHEAFTAMRARGAKVTDVVVLVVAADDGVMSQTTEAIDHARAANVPIVVAINKIDKPEADPGRVKRQLADYGLVPEEWGGNTLYVDVSAKQRKGISELLEVIGLQSDILELKANPNKWGRGRIVEARLDKGRGPVATVLIQEGSLNVGDSFVCGVNYGRVRALFDDSGNKVESAGPSIPIEIQGISGVPMAGDELIVVEDEKRAKQVAFHRQQKQREAEIVRIKKISLEGLYDRIKEGEVKELNVVLKADVQGSIEALSEALKRLSTPEVKINILHSSTGSITETDIMLASASDAIVIGFNVRPNPKAHDLAGQEIVDVRYYDVVYKVTSDIKNAMIGLLKPTYREKVLGHAEVRQLFSISRIGTVAGSYVIDGKVERGSKIRLIRDEVVIYDGHIASLKRFKEDVAEVSVGYECGILLENYNDIKVNDTLESYEVEEIRPVLE